uniref:Peptidase_M13 domain-containing protein n=2 Tax=Panagrellus redivivus TaxID=6233 RepID=A0A7E4UNA5_PANRE
MDNFVFGCLFLAFVFLTWIDASSDDLFSPESMQYSIDIDRRINENVNPCDDFYGYSCSNPTPVNSTLIVVRSEATQKILHRLNTGKKPGDGEAVNKYYDLYKQCTTVRTEKNLNQTILDYAHDFDKLFEGVEQIDAAQLAKITAYLLVHHDFSLITSLGKSKPVHKRFSNFRSVLFVNAPKELSQSVYYYFDPNIADTFKNALRTHLAHINSMANDEYLNKTVPDMYNLEVAIAQVVVVPMEIKNMQTLTVTKETLTSLYLKCSKFLTKSILDDRVIIHLDMTIVNAFYEPSSNKIVVPIAMLQLTSPNYIPAAIYGNVGAVIGHEIIHGIDTNFAHFDGDGHINPWMSQAGQASFDSMVQCVVNEYNEYNATDAKNNTFKVNGAQTAGENVADNGGLRAAYNAFLSDPEWNKPFPRTPKLKDTTNEQLFFLAFNRYFCIPPFDASLASHYVHSPYKIRVLGTLRNFEPFRKAFNCPVNSKYAPEKHCDVYAPSDAQSVNSNVAALSLFSVSLIMTVL